VNCTVFVQDQRLRVLANIDCGDQSSSMEETVVLLPPEVTAVRTFFASAERTAMVLPNRLRLSYHHGSFAR